MRVVIDTNVLLVSISRKSRYHPIFQAILDGSVELCISNAILEEYQEIIGREWSPTMAENVTEVLLKSPSVLRFDPHYNWVLIKDDPDDDKFADCAVASSAYFFSSLPLMRASRPLCPKYLSIRSEIENPISPIEIAAAIAVKNISSVTGNFVPFLLLEVSPNF